MSVYFSSCCLLSIQSWSLVHPRLQHVHHVFSLLPRSPPLWYTLPLPSSSFLPPGVMDSYHSCLSSTHSLSALCCVPQKISRDLVEECGDISQKGMHYATCYIYSSILNYILSYSFHFPLFTSIFISVFYLPSPSVFLSSSFCHCVWTHTHPQWIHWNQFSMSQLSLFFFSSTLTPYTSHPPPLYLFLLFSLLIVSLSSSSACSGQHELSWIDHPFTADTHQSSLQLRYSQTDSYYHVFIIITTNITS